MFHVQFGCFVFKLTIGKSYWPAPSCTLPKLSIACPVLQRASGTFQTSGGKLPQEGRLGKNFGEKWKVNSHAPSLG
jgi:hypothetical protein